MTGGSRGVRPFLIARARSFGFAFRGIGHVLASQPNAWIHAVATLAVAGLALALRVGAGGWAALLLAMALVWTAEAMNTALERLADAVSEERREGIRRAKDAAAGAVLLASIGAALAGLAVLGPPLWAWWAGR